MLTVGMLREAMSALPDDAVVQVSSGVGHHAGRLSYAERARVVGDPAYGFVVVEGSGEPSDAAHAREWRDPLEDPFEAALACAGRLGACPIPLLPDFYTNHWDRDSLCSCFGCAECVAGPEDLGYVSGDEAGAGPVALDDAGSFDVDGQALPF